MKLPSMGPMLRRWNAEQVALKLLFRFLVHEIKLAAVLTIAVGLALVVIAYEVAILHSLTGF